MILCVIVTQSCLTLCDPMDCSPPGSSVHGILQERILEWVAISSSRDRTRSPALQADSLPSEPPGKPYLTFRTCKYIDEQVDTVKQLLETARVCSLFNNFCVCSNFAPQAGSISTLKHTFFLFFWFIMLAILKLQNLVDIAPLIIL